MTPLISRRLGRTARFCCLAAVVLSAHARAELVEPGPEVMVKVGFVGNFAKLVEWPADANLDPLNVCVAGDSEPIGAAFSKLEGKTAQSHSIKLTRNVQPASAGLCHVLFLPRGSERQFPDLLRATAKSRTLTVSDVAGFSDAGGMIELIMVDNRIQFEVNNSMTKRAGLKLSSQLLKLARQVKE
jgi:hypothetical protein